MSTTTSTFTVTGMHCGGCAPLIDETIEETAGPANGDLSLDLQPAALDSGAYLLVSADRSDSGQGTGTRRRGIGHLRLHLRHRFHPARGRRPRRGHDRLAYDSRWVHGLPPRTEPELAWVQHALAHLRIGGTAALLMPTAAALRPAGRRIRAELVRSGTLRAVGC